MTVCPRRVTRLRRAAILFTLVVTFLLAGAVPSFADNGIAPSPGSSEQLTDSSGIPIDAYRALPIDRGGWAANQDKMFWSKPVDFIWGGNFQDSSNAILFNRWNMDFGWVDWITGPSQSLSTGFEQFTGKLPWKTLVGSLAGLVVGYLIFRGRTGAAWSEIVVASVLLALASTVLMNPVQTVVGSDGLIVKARDYAKESSAEILSGTRGADGKQPAEVVNANASQPMVDAFVRIPYQVIAFGKSIDGNPACKAKFDEVMKGVKYSTDADGEKIRKAVSGCDETLGKHAEQPDAFMVINAYTARQSILMLCIFVMVLGGLMLLCVVMLLWEATKSIWNAKAGVVAGSSRGALIRSLVMGSFSLVFLVGSFLFLSLYMLMIRMVLTGRMAEYSYLLWTTMNFLLLFGMGLMIWFWVKGRKKGEGLADRLRRLGAGSPERQQSPITLQKAISTVRELSNHRLLRQAAGSGTSKKDGSKGNDSNESPSDPQPVKPRKGQTPAPRPALGPGPVRGQLPPGPNGAGGAGPGPGPGSPSPVGPRPGSPSGGGARTRQIVPGVVLDEKLIDLTPAQRRKAAASSMIRAASHQNPYSRAAARAYDGLKTLRQPAQPARRHMPTRAQSELAAKLGTKQPLPYRTVPGTRQ